MIPLDELIKPLTEEEVLEKFLANLETLSVPARTWRKGGSLRTILRVTARLVSDLTKLMAAVIEGGFLDKAKGAWLTLLAFYVYGVTRKSASYATGELTLTNTSGVPYVFGAEQLRALKTISSTVKKAYVNTAGFTLGAGVTLTIPVRAVEVGTSSNANPGEIDSLEVSLFGVTVTNDAAVLGLDEETDPELRQACIDKLGTLSLAGPRGAYAFAATRATRPDGTPVNINRVQVSPQSSTGVVDVYCAAPSGAPDPTDLTYVRENIEAIARPDSVTCNVYAATNVAFARAITLYAVKAPGVSAADMKALAENAVAEFFRGYPVGGLKKPPSTQGKLYADRIDAAVIAVHSSIYDADGSGADMDLNAGQVATNSVAIAVTLVDG